LLIFLIANTIFLVSEQHSLYKIFGYDTPTAIAVAILTEIAVVLLSYFACTTRTKNWKLGLYAALVFSVFVLHGLVTTGAKDKGSAQLSNQKEFLQIEKRIANLEGLEQLALTRITNVNPATHPSLIAALSKKLNSDGAEGYTFKIDGLRTELKGMDQTSEAKLISDKTNILVRQ
jgi:hypothetical protein